MREFWKTGIKATTSGAFMTDPSIVVEIENTRYGPLWALRDDAYQTQSLLAYGEYSPGETRLFKKLVRPGDTVIDAGANQGFLTVPLSEIVGETGKVIAFEPQPEIFAILKKNCGHRANVELYMQALGEVAGMTTIPSLKELALTQNNFGANTIGHGEFNVQVIALDSMEFDSLRMIKADVEGCEVAMLRGAKETIKKHRPILYLENDKPPLIDALIAEVQGLGYDCYWHVVPFFYADNFLGNPDDMFNGQRSWNMMCAPKDTYFRVADQEPIPEGWSMAKLAAKMIKDALEDQHPVMTVQSGQKEEEPM